MAPLLIFLHFDNHISKMPPNRPNSIRRPDCGARMNRLKRLLLLTPLLIVFSCQDNPVTALEPVAKQKSNNNFAITSLSDGRTLSGGPGEANEEIQALIAAGRVDTVYAEQFRVGKMPKEIPDGFWKMSTIFQVSAEGDAIQYNYVLPGGVRSIPRLYFRLGHRARLQPV